MKPERLLPGMLDDALQWISALINPSDVVSEEDKQRAVAFVNECRNYLNKIREEN